MAFLNSAAVDSPFNMLWITCDVHRAHHSAVLDTLANWVPAARAKGKKVVLYGVKSSL